MTKSEDFINFFISFNIVLVSDIVPLSKSVLIRVLKLYKTLQKKFLTLIILFNFISSSVSVFFNSLILKLAFSCSISNNFVYCLFVIKSVIKKYFNNSLPSFSLYSGLSFFLFLTSVQTFSYSFFSFNFFIILLQLSLTNFSKVSLNALKPCSSFSFSLKIIFLHKSILSNKAERSNKVKHMDL